MCSVVHSVCEYVCLCCKEKFAFLVAVLYITSLCFLFQNNQSDLNISLSYRFSYLLLVPVLLVMCCMLLSTVMHSLITREEICKRGIANSKSTVYACSIHTELYKIHDLVPHEIVKCIFVWCPLERAGRQTYLFEHCRSLKNVVTTWTSLGAWSVDLWPCTLPDSDWLISQFQVFCKHLLMSVDT
jgi:hypothetical protein